LTRNSIDRLEPGPTLDPCVAIAVYPPSGSAGWTWTENRPLDPTEVVAVRIGWELVLVPEYTSTFAWPESDDRVLAVPLKVGETTVSGALPSESSDTVGGGTLIVNVTGGSLVPVPTLDP
jgi:hypothetical protein